MSEVSLVDGHIDNGMTDEDIIKTLECCTQHQYCCPKDCPLYEYDVGECDMYLMQRVLDLINRQKAEIERLKNERIERIRKLTREVYDREIAQAKIEAIKEFVERLKIFVIPQKADGYTREIVLKSNIDNLVKEMTDIKE